MSGSGDIDPYVSGEEAAWRDLVARFDSQSQIDVAAVPWPARENLSDPGSVAPQAPAADDVAPQAPAADDGAAAATTVSPVERTRIVRPAGDPRSYAPPDEEDELYVPAPLPPPATMDAMSKGAWAALICGPGYLLLGTLLGWTISGTEALVAIAAFVAGFVVLVLRMGDRPPRDDNDDGAVL